MENKNNRRKATAADNVWNYLAAEQYLAQNARDFVRARALCDAIRLLEAAGEDRAAAWIANERLFIARHPSLISEAASLEAEAARGRAAATAACAAHEEATGRNWLD